MNGDQKGLLVMVSGPSGVGKGAIGKGVLQCAPTAKMSVSVTTRSKRPGEEEGTNYFYRSEEEFIQMVEEGKFLEYTRVFNRDYYGTPKDYVEEQRNLGYDVILEIDVQGATNVKKLVPDAIGIFIAPPSMEELKKRLIGRGTETPEVQQKRFQTAVEELKLIKEYDYIVVNDDLEQATQDVCAILRAEKRRTCRNSAIVNKYLEVE